MENRFINFDTYNVTLKKMSQISSSHFGSSTAQQLLISTGMFPFSTIVFTNRTEMCQNETQTMKKL